MIGTEVAAAIIAARKAIGEAEAILAAAREAFGIKERRRAGPLARKFTPAPLPEPVVGDLWMLSDAEQDEVRAAVIMLRLVKLKRRDAFLRAAGLHLLALRAERDRAEWLDITAHEVGLRQARVYELIGLARGKSAEKLRQIARERQQKKRAKSKLAKLSWKH